MTDIAPHAIFAMYGDVVAHVPSMEQSGIVGNAAHRYGYHCSRNRLHALGEDNDYSIADSTRDQQGNAANASAIDMKFSSSDMKLVSNRLIAAGKVSDPRLGALREFFGTVDGQHVTGWSTLRHRYTTSSDVSHLWHIHLSIYRDSADNAAACAAIAAVISGIVPASALKKYWLSLVLEARKKEILLSPTVKTHADTVMAFERGLVAWGFPGHLVIDGHYGTSTDDAVKWFQGQVSSGIKPDGVMGEHEWARFAAGPGGKPLFVPELGNYERWV